MSEKRKKKNLLPYVLVMLLILLLGAVLIASYIALHSDLNILQSQSMDSASDTGNAIEPGTANIQVTAESEIESEEVNIPVTSESGTESTQIQTETERAAVATVSAARETESEDVTDNEDLSDDEIMSEPDLLADHSAETDEANEQTDEISGGDETSALVEEYLETLSIEEKIAQMFIVTPEALTGAGVVTAAGETTKAAFSQYPVGGLVYSTSNITSEAQLVEMLGNIQSYSMERIGVVAFLCLDEEGGTVTRISGKGVIDVPYITSMETIGLGEPEDAFETGATIGGYLSKLLFNVDFAPVADVATNPDNTVIGSRSFGSEPEKVAEMVASFVRGIQGEGVSATLKHFPGHGDTSEDSHLSRSYSYKTLEELWKCEFLPFISGIEAGCDFVMVGHISLPNVTGDDTPATLSYQLVTEILREEMGFEGIVVTDAMNMAAITSYYSSSEAAVAAVKAGVDMILMPYDFQSAYNGLISAVNSGEISEERVNESLRRILTRKFALMT